VTPGGADSELTAEEMMAQLEGDPEWVARRDRQEHKRQQARQINRNAAAPIVAELREAGFELARSLICTPRGRAMGTRFRFCCGGSPRSITRR
jgi:hypothetical protein